MQVEHPRSQSRFFHEAEHDEGDAQTWVESKKGKSHRRRACPSFLLHSGFFHQRPDHQTSDESMQFIGISLMIDFLTKYLFLSK